MPSLKPADDPLPLATRWMALARLREPDVSDAAALATCGEDNHANVRIVLARGPLEGGFVFYTNAESRKGEELANAPEAALCWHWKSLKRQLRAEGITAIVPDEEADFYFQRRPRMSQIGAWASEQSRPCASRAELEKRFAETKKRFAGEKVPRPPWWKGYRLTPLKMEFWQHRAWRLHERLVYHRPQIDAVWHHQILFP